MKRRMISLLLCLSLVSILPLTAHAVFYEDHQVSQHVVDQADILTDQETNELESLARALSESSSCEVLIAAVEDMDDYSAGEYSAALNSGYWWDSDDAILFLLAMEEREWYIATFGDAIYIFTDYALDTLGEAAVVSFSDGNYYEGFVTYLNMLPKYFKAWQDGTSYVYDPVPRDEVVNYASTHRSSLWDVLPVSLIIGIIAGAISIFAMRYSMNTKRRQHSAGDYLKSGSYHLRLHQDIFLYSNLSKTRRQQNTGGSTGHGGHRSSGGRSHGGRGGRF